MRYAVYSTDKIKLAKFVIKRDVKRYLKWKHSWKTSTAGVLILFLAVLLSWNVLHSSAATVTLTPDSDVTAGWASTGGTSDASCAGGTHCDFVDDGTTDNTGDYVGTGTNGAGGEIEEYTMTSQSSVSSATQFSVRVYAESATNANGGTLDSLSINIRINGTLQTASTCTPFFNTWSACTANFSGSWNQAAVDSLQVQITRNRLGSGSPGSQDDDVRIANVNVTMTYTSTIAFNQSAYGWFGNQDAASPVTFASTYGTAGNTQWNKIIPTSDGGYAVVGTVWNAPINQNALTVARFDGTGNVIWASQWGAVSSGLGLMQQSDGGFVASGFSGSGSALIIKFTSSGSLSWEHTWASGPSSTGVAVTQATNGNILLLVNYSGSVTLTAVVQYDSSGNYLSHAAIYVASNSGFQPMDITATTAGGYAVTGVSTTNVYTFEVASGGSVSWAKSWTLASGLGTPKGIVEDASGNIIVTGYTSGVGTNNEMFTLKYNSTGALQWNDIYGDAGSADDSALGVTLSGDGGYIVAGTTAASGAGSSDVALIKYDSSGSLVWKKTWGTSGADTAYGVTKAADGGYALVGSANGSSGLFLKVDSSGAASGCSSPMCQNATGTNNTSPTVTTGSLTLTTTTVTDTKTTPSTTTASLTLTVTSQVSAQPNMTVGSTLAAQDTAATAPGDGTIFRLRLDLHVSGAVLSTGAAQFKLQYAAKGAGTCSAPTGTYTDVSASSSVIRYADNVTAASGLGLTTNASDPKHGTDSNVNQTYQETSSSIFTNTSSVSIGQDGMWDFGLVLYHSLQSTTYCFKVVNGDNSNLSTYTVYPEITTPAATFSQAAVRWYNPAPSGSSLTFAKTYGDSGYGSWVNDMVGTSDGGYVTVGGAGYTDFYNSYDMQITKYDSSGSVVWTNYWGNYTNLADEGKSVVQTSDGGFAVTGYTTSFGAGNTDVFVAKYSSSGALSWSQVWGGTGYDDGDGITQVTGGNLVVAGNTSSYGTNTDMVILRYNVSTGAFISNTTWGTAGLDQVGSITATSDGGYAITGGTADIYIAKFASNDSLTWSYTWGGASTDAGYRIIQTSTGGYAIAGITSSIGAGSQDAVLVTFDSSGTLTGTLTIGGTNGSDVANDVAQTSDGGFVLAGTSGSYGAGSVDAFTAKVTSSSAVSWTDTFGTSNQESASGVVETSTGGYAVGGTYGTATSSSGKDLLLLYDGSGGMTGCSSPLCQQPSMSSDSSLRGTRNTLTLSSTNPAATHSSVTPSNEFSLTDSQVITLVAAAAPVGTPFAAQNKPLDLTTLTTLTLRVAISVDGSGIDTSGSSPTGQSFKLQFAPLIGATSCSAVSSGSYNDVTSSSAVKFYDDSRYADGQSITSDPTDPSDGSRTMASQTYEESNDFSNTQSSIYAGQDGIWQFSLSIDSATIKGRAFCLRVATSGGIQLTAANIAKVANSTQSFQRLRQGNWWNEEGKRQYINL